MRRLTRVSALLLALALITGCAAGRAFRRGEDRARVGDWDAAVTYYRQAMQANPGRAEYRIALERAMLNASRVHFDAARQLEAKDQLDAALLEYRRTVEYDPGNRQALERVVQLERTIRDRIEASRPKPAIVQLREQARQLGAAPLLNPASRAPVDYSFKQSSLRDILTFISNASGINVIYDASFQDRPVTIQLQGSVEQALNTLLSSQGLFYTVLDERTIVVAQDTAPNRLKYERQVAITLPISYADATEIAQMLTAITRTTTGVTIPPVILPNKTANTVTVRATQPVIDVIQALVLSNDKPRAEITLDIEILEVSRTRTKELGLDLSAHQIGLIFSPEQAPPGSAGAPSGVTGASENRPFNVNTISQGVSTADFYLAVPQAVINFLETDANTRFLAQSQLRGSEGAQLTYKVGSDEPYLTTSFSPIAGGGANVNPLSSYTFRTVGISIQATPRLVTEEGDVLLDLVMSNDTLGPPRNVGGQFAPSFPTRSVTTKLRLRDGESHLLAGLLQDDERRSLKGFPGLISVPILKNIFGSSDDVIGQTDIVMLLTPRIIRTHEYTAKDLSPIYVGTNQNFGLTGPPPLIAAPPVDAVPPPGASPAPPAQGVPPQGVPVPTVPQAGAPGLVTTPVPQAPPPSQALQPQTAPPPLAEPQKDLTTPQPTTLAPMAQITVTPPQGDVRVGSGPYLVPLYVNGVSRASTVSVTVTFNPALLRVRTVQEGSFLRQGATNVVFTPNIDPATGRIDLTFVRTGDANGASGSGLLAAIQFDAVAAGNSALTLSGVASNPTGGAIPLQFVPASVVVR
jgi:general secretion pathway protein D